MKQTHSHKSLVIPFFDPGLQDYSSEDIRKKGNIKNPNDEKMLQEADDDHGTTQTKPGRHGASQKSWRQKQEQW